MDPVQFRSFLRAVLPSMGYRWRRFDRRNVRRRVTRRMERLGIHEASRYTRLAVDNPLEREALEALLNITITRFFRNGRLWPVLEEVVQGLGAAIPPGEILRFWSAGCAGGEEPYSLAMVLDDMARTGRLTGPWTILGTDRDASSLDRTRSAAYRWGSVREVPGHLRERWFEKDGDEWILDDRIRSLVTVKAHDLLRDEPPGPFHMVFLRNSVLTYNSLEVQTAVLGRIRGCLRGPGYLVIGRTERLPGGAGFEEAGWGVYRKRE